MSSVAVPERFVVGAGAASLSAHVHEAGALLVGKRMKLQYDPEAPCGKWNGDKYAAWVKREIHRIANPVMIKATYGPELQGRLKLMTHGPRKRVMHWKEAASQIIRVLMHIHEDQIQKIIGSYVRVNELKVGKESAFETLQEELKREYETCCRISKTEDRNVLKEFAENVALQQTIHKVLLALKRKVVLLEWGCEWKNFLYFWCYDRGPGNTTMASISARYGDDSKEMDEVFTTIGEITFEEFCGMTYQDWVQYPDSSKRPQTESARLTRMKKAISGFFKRFEEKFLKRHPDDAYRMQHTVKFLSLIYLHTDSSMFPEPLWIGSEDESDASSRSDGEEGAQDYTKKGRRAQTTYNNRVNRKGQPKKP